MAVDCLYVCNDYLFFIHYSLITVFSYYCIWRIDFDCFVCLCKLWFVYFCELSVVLWFCFFPVQLMINFGVGLMKVMVVISVYPYACFLHYKLFSVVYNIM